MQIGCYTLKNNLLLAPMAGITDRPFRELCRQFGAGLAVSEMVASNPALQNHKKTLLKSNHNGESGIRSVQILGADPKQMADAALLNQQRGADIIDINMGCPAKKVCSVAAGSALLKNEKLVRQILECTVNAVNIPVTLKIRTGWDSDNRNAIKIAQIAEQSGIAALTVHGRTRACKFNGEAEYKTIKQVKQSVNIPIIANGDINCAKKAKFVLDYTGADGLMIGRAGQGKPWVFNEILQQLNSSKTPKKQTIKEIQSTINTHLEQLYSFYGNNDGVRIARKHIGWYFEHLGSIPKQREKEIFQVLDPSQQIAMVNSVFSDIDLAY
ncbi:MAG: tRNA dihydrouridine synthase DusB [Methylococcales symbiont of Iophon sp. n. MRB-2018]|nr:MAG: tRNA dihydrouridine synthase DusB [Methylococcales symbiont of Iophon sp. n. MRB-2018]KAF3979733.1 MAG: tRNA dihydrouridine synthase DusB [Methylococcales symbiont of Iophon sp. n. MRB-2018]